MGSLATSAWLNLAYLRQEVKLAFSQLESTGSPDLGSFAAPVLHSHAFRYGSKTIVPTMGTIASWSGENSPAFDLDLNMPYFELDRKAARQWRLRNWPHFSRFPAKGAFPTAKSLAIDVNSEGGICVFVPVFVINGDLVVNVDEEGWTEARARTVADVAS